MGGTPTGGIDVQNVAVVPTANVAGGGVPYVDAGALKFLGGNGTLTTIAAA